MFGARLFFFGWTLVLPAVLHPIWAVLLLHLFASFTLGIVLAISFQLAHCHDEAEFPTVTECARADRDWAVHQLETTADFAQQNTLLTWFLGGLNFQIEHHLFPKVCHVHYPALSRIVAATCAEYGVPYRVHTTLRAALASHIRWLAALGRGADETHAWRGAHVALASSGVGNVAEPRTRAGRFGASRERELDGANC